MDTNISKVVATSGPMIIPYDENSTFIGVAQETSSKPLKMITYLNKSVDESTTVDIDDITTTIINDSNKTFDSSTSSMEYILDEVQNIYTTSDDIIYDSVEITSDTMEELSASGEMSSILMTSIVDERDMLTENFAFYSDTSVGTAIEISTFEMVNSTNEYTESDSPTDPLISDVFETISTELSNTLELNETVFTTNLDKSVFTTDLQESIVTTNLQESIFTTNVQDSVFTTSLHEYTSTSDYLNDTVKDEYISPIQFSPCQLLDDIPDVKDYVLDLSLPWLIITVIAVTAGLITLALWLEVLVDLQRRLRLWYLKSKILWIVGIYPVYSTACIAGLIAPRIAVLMDLFASIYISVALYQFWILMIALHEGVQQMEERLGGNRVPINSCPLLCCCPCLPKPFISRGSILCMEILILQHCILKPLLILVPAAIGLNSGTNYLLLDAEMDLQSFKVANMVCIVSTLVAIYGLAVMCNLSSHPLRGLHIRAKSYLMQYTLVFINIQHCIIPFIIWPLYDYNFIPCFLVTYDLGMEARRLQLCLLLLELMILMIITRHYYKQRVPTGQSYFDFIDDEDLAMMEYCRADQRHLK